MCLIEALSAMDKTDLSVDARSNHEPE